MSSRRGQASENLYEGKGEGIQKQKPYHCNGYIDMAFLSSRQLRVPDISSFPTTRGLFALRPPDVWIGAVAVRTHTPSACRSFMPLNTVCLIWETGVFHVKHRCPPTDGELQPSYRGSDSASFAGVLHRFLIPSRHYKERLLRSNLSSLPWTDNRYSITVTKIDESPSFPKF